MKRKYILATLLCALLPMFLAIQSSRAGDVTPQLLYDHNNFSTWLGLGKSTLHYFDDYKNSVSAGLEYSTMRVGFELTVNYANNTLEDQWNITGSESFPYTIYTRDGIFDFIAKYDIFRGEYDSRVFIGSGIGVSFTKLKYLKDFAWVDGAVTEEVYVDENYSLVTIPLLAEFQYRISEKLGFGLRGTFHYSYDAEDHKANYYIQDGSDVRIGDRGFGHKSNFATSLYAKYYF